MLIIEDRTIQRHRLIIRSKLVNADEQEAFATPFKMEGVRGEGLRDAPSVNEMNFGSFRLAA